MVVLVLTLEGVVVDSGTDSIGVVEAWGAEEVFVARSEFFQAVHVSYYLLLLLLFTVYCSFISSGFQDFNSNSNKINFTISFQCSFTRFGGCF